MHSFCFPEYFFRLFGSTRILGFQRCATIYGKTQLTRNQDCSIYDSTKNTHTTYTPKSLLPFKNRFPFFRTRVPSTEKPIISQFRPMSSHRSSMLVSQSYSSIHSIQQAHAGAGWSKIDISRVADQPRINKSNPCQRSARTHSTPAVRLR